VGAALVLGVLVHASRASADEKQACVAASEKAQQLRSAGKLGEARDQLNVCGRPECPKLVRQDCTEWMSELLASLPSVVPGAKDRNGRDLVDVRLRVDGTLTAERLDGKPIVIDPGVHTFLFEAKGAPAVSEQVVIKPGEKNRIVIVTFATPDDHPAPPAPPSTAPLAEDRKRSSTPIVAYVLGGLGLAALGGALYFDLGAGGDAHDLRTSCAPNCAQSDVDDIKTKYTVAGVTAGVGGALVVTSIVLLLTSGKRSNTASLSTGAPLRF
jgi:hypothetical protein